MIGAVSVADLGKRFPRRDGHLPRTFKEAFVRGFGERREYFWGLRDISFDVAPGRAVGILGRNGAGKSTLLRLIGGIGRPDEGRATATGRVGALLDLDAGLAEDLTGAENAYVAGVVAGLTRAEIGRRFDEIVAFAELEDVIDSPLRTYSSGMRMRLAFAVAAHIDPEILLIDEVLAVGDFAFQAKCLERIAEIKRTGCTILVVSHDLSPVTALCDEAILLRAGRLIAHGPAAEVVRTYERSMAPDAYDSTTAVGVADVALPGGRRLRYGANRFGTLEAEILAVRLLTPQGAPVATIAVGQPLVVEFDYRARAPIERLNALVKLCSRDGRAGLETTNATAGVAIAPTAAPATAQVAIARVDLAPGDYHVDVSLHEQNWRHSYDSHVEAYPLRLAGGPGGRGLLAPPHRWSVEPSARGPAAPSATSSTVAAMSGDRPESAGAAKTLRV